MSSYIPEHIQVEILRRLPVKTLLRFRCVCISWKQHIDSQAFIHEHLAIQKPRLIVQYEENELLILDPRTLPSFNIITNGWHHVIGTLHGVVCLFDYRNTFRLWNPSIRKFLTLPETDIDYDYIERDYVTLSDSLFTSFWIDPYTKTFKIVLFHQRYSGYDLMYSSVENKWKLPPNSNFLEDYACIMGYRSIVIESVAYWGAIPSKNTMVVICFDFGKEIFYRVKAPSLALCGSPDDELVLYECQGGLSVACLDSEKRCDLYSMKEDSWIKMFSFNLDPRVNFIWWVMEEKESMQEYVRVLTTIEMGLEESAVALCDTKSASVTLRGGIGRYNFDKLIFVNCNFVESFVFP